MVVDKQVVQLSNESGEKVRLWVAMLKYLVQAYHKIAEGGVSEVEELRVVLRILPRHEAEVQSSSQEEHGCDLHFLIRL